MVVCKYRAEIVYRCVMRGGFVRFGLCIFDLDGTIVDTRRDLATAVNEVRARYGLPETGVDEVTGHVGDGVVKLIERSLPIDDIDIDDAVSLFKQIYDAHLLDTTQPYPGISDVLSALNNRFLAILTNKPYRHTKVITDSLGLTSFFSLIVGGDSIEKKKPDPDGIEYILDKSGAVRNRSVMIGDGKNDIMAAHASGIASIYVTYGFTDITEFDGDTPDYTIDSPHELISILKR
jgi:phosphoglycolate phosphatase